MAKNNADRVYSRYVLEALRLMANAIKVKRIESKITLHALAERAGISRGLLQRIEHADPGCSIGAVFEVASILGISLFNANYAQLLVHNKNIDEKLTLLPSEVRQPKVELDDDF